MRIQVVLDQHDLFGIREVYVAQITQDFRIIDGRAPFGDLDMTPTLDPASYCTHAFLALFEQAGLRLYHIEA
jgi:hypothetical protein